MSIIVQTINDAFNVFSESEFILLIAVFMFGGVLRHAVDLYWSIWFEEEKEEVEL